MMLDDAESSESARPGRAEAGEGSRRDVLARLFGASSGRGGEGGTPDGGGDFIRLASIESPLGPLLAGAVDAGVCLLEFEDRRSMDAQVAALRARLAAPADFSPHHVLEALEEELADYFAGKLKKFDSPLVEPGTPFQESVWAALRDIPYGETRSYAELARAVGNPKAVRAVAQANGRNRIAILVPCHRVINTGGKLGGYGGGLWRKRRLLEIEAGAGLGL